MASVRSALNYRRCKSEKSNYSILEKYMKPFELIEPHMILLTQGILDVFLFHIGREKHERPGYSLKNKV